MIKKTPLNYFHLKIVLEAFGKFHAISFAYYTQQKEEFKKLVNSFYPVLLHMFANKSITDPFDVTVQSVLKILKDRNELELCEKYQEYLKTDIIEDVNKLVHEETACKVLSHRDLWNNNLMFLYNNNNERKALIIDWQMADVANTPVYDLSYFLYACSAVSKLENLEDLLKIYYKSFSDYLRELGSNPEELFSFATLKEHWRKFSKYGFLFIPYLMKQCYWTDEEAPKIENLSELSWAESVDRIVIKNENYYTRLIGIIKHVLNYELK